jgi:hypothetical protein
MGRTPRYFHPGGFAMTKILILLAALPLVACSDDKAQHYAAGLAVSHVVTQRTGSAMKGCMASFGAGLAKEAFDSVFGGTVDGGDVLATGAGCSLSYHF